MFWCTIARALVETLFWCKMFQAPLAMGGGTLRSGVRRWCRPPSPSWGIVFWHRMLPAPIDF